MPLTEDGKPQPEVLTKHGHPKLPKISFFIIIIVIIIAIITIIISAIIIVINKLYFLYVFHKLNRNPAKKQ